MRQFFLTIVSAATIGCCSATANAQTTCYIATEAETELKARSRKYFTENVISAGCAVVMAGGALSMFSENIDDDVKGAVVLGAIGCGIYCLTEDAVCGQATAKLTGYAASIAAASRSKYAICGN